MAPHGPDTGKGTLHRQHAGLVFECGLQMRRPLQESGKQPNGIERLAKDPHGYRRQKEGKKRTITVKSSSLPSSMQPVRIILPNPETWA